MKAIVVTKFGGPHPHILHFEAADLPKVSPTKILVQIASAGVNPVDTYIREGAFLHLPELPFTPGKDAAGIIREVGAEVKNFKVGDRVFICKRKVDRWGTYAEYCLVDENEVFPLHSNLTFNQGAAIGVPYFTAYRALVIKGNCQAGETVLIHGASGAVGIAAIQIAKLNHLMVIGTAGTPAGMALIKDVGADYVLCHKSVNYLDKIQEITDDKGVDIVVEMLANVNMQKDLDILAPKGRLLIVGSRGSVQIDPRSILGDEIQVIGIALLRSTEEEWNKTAENILRIIEVGLFIKPVIDKEYSLENAYEAHRDIMKSTGAKGKLILKISDLL